MAVKNGHVLRLYLDDVAVAKAVTCQFSLSKDLIETAHKDTAGGTAGWREVEGGQKSVSLSSDFLFAEEDADIDTIFDAFLNDTVVVAKFADEVTAGTMRLWSCNALITGLEVVATDNENVQCSVQLEGSGAMARSTQVIT